MIKSLSKLVVNRLSGEKEQRLTARQIANWILETETEWCTTKKDRSSVITTDDELLQQLVAEIGSQRTSIQKQYPKVKTTAERPKKYYWSDKSDEEEIEEETSIADRVLDNSQKSLSEADLYPILSSYLLSELGVYSKRIDERRSSNSLKSGSNQWLYPDLVGMEDLFSEWSNDVQNLVDVTSQSLSLIHI